MPWPPPYVLRTSERSRRLSLRISSRNGLEIIVPKHTSTKTALKFLNSKIAWVTKHLHLLEVKKEAVVLPPSLHLPTINEEWQIRSCKMRAAFKVDQAVTCLFLNQALDTDQYPALLRNWLIRKAKLHLPAMLLSYSRKYQLPFRDVTIRLQRSRWGSCSLNKNINLNARLLLLPHEITHYVMVHELVHTVHFDHSPQFWSAVCQIVPNQQQLRENLKSLEPKLPFWLY